MRTPTQTRVKHQTNSRAPTHSYNQLYMNAMICLCVCLTFDLHLHASHICRKNFKKLIFLVTRKPRMLHFPPLGCSWWLLTKMVKIEPMNSRCSFQFLPKSYSGAIRMILSEKSSSRNHSSCKNFVDNKNLWRGLAKKLVFSCP
jgi:hypothetical protein